MFQMFEKNISYLQLLRMSATHSPPQQWTFTQNMSAEQSKFDNNIVIYQIKNSNIVKYY